MHPTPFFCPSTYVCKSLIKKTKETHQQDKQQILVHFVKIFNYFKNWVAKLQFEM
jgi:hypothetical protein